MRDIAAASGVSQSTVSRVLSGVESRVPIAAETRQRIVEAARSLGYRPNPLARGLRGASTNLIGAVVRDFSDPFFAEAIEALVVESMSHGYNVVLGHVQDGLDEAHAARTVKDSDAARRDYLKRFYGIDEELPTHYDVVVNTDVLSFERAAQVIGKAAA